MAARLNTTGSWAGSASSAPRRSKGLQAALGACFLLVIGIALISWECLQALRSDADWLSHSERVRFEIGRVLQTLTDVETGERGFAIEQSEGFLEPYRPAVARLDGELASLSRLVADNPAQVALAQRLSTLAMERVDTAGRVIDSVRSRDVATTKETVSLGKQQMDSARAVIAQMWNEEGRLLQERNAAELRSQRDAVIATLSMIGVALVLLVWVGYLTAKNSARVLQEGERRLRSALDAFPQLAWINLPNGKFQFFNRDWLAYTGLTEGESLQDDAWSRVVHPQDYTRSSAAWKQALVSGELFEDEFLLRRHDGAYRWFLGRALPDRDQHGIIVEWFGTCTDIDAAKRNEERLKLTEIALRDADARKDVFLATLSHELRNPLAPIRTAARLLEVPNVDAEAIAKSSAIISRQVRQMAALLDDLLDVSRITRGALTIKKRYVALQDVLKEALEALQPLMESKNHALRVDWPEQAIEIEADPVRVVQIVVNLLTNSAKYTDPGGRIELAVSIEQGAALICVRDNGIGIAPENLNKVFEMFAQVAHDEKHDDVGLGIGLALAKGLVELHGGRIEARSGGLQRGSELRVFMPLAQRSGDAWMNAEVAQHGHATSTTALRILVADDNPDTAQSLAALLEISGHKISIAYSGLQALELFPTWRPDVAILDLGMPGLDGLEAARRVRSEAWGAAVRLIAVTGRGQEEDRQASRLAGFDHHFTKPVDFDELAKFLFRPDEERRAS